MKLVLFLGSWIASVQSIYPTILEPAYPALSLAAGWSTRLIAQGPTKPRTILFDMDRGLLILQQGNYTAATGTVESSNQTIITNSTFPSPLAIALKPLSPVTNDDPTTRSLLTTKLTPNQLLISRDDTILNINPEAKLPPQSTAN